MSEALSLIWRDERKLSVFEYMMLRRIFRFKMEEVKGQRMRLHNVDLIDCTRHPIYWCDKIGNNEMGWACGACRGGEETYKALLGKP